MDKTVIRTPRGCVKRNKNTETQKHGALYFIGFQNKFSVTPSLCVQNSSLRHIPIYLIPLFHLMDVQSFLPIRYLNLR